MFQIIELQDSTQTTILSCQAVETGESVRVEPSQDPDTGAKPEPADVRPLDDGDFFKAVPVAVRQPIKLPKHAAHILDSRIDSTEQDQDEG